MNQFNPNPQNYFGQFQNEMERQAISQAQDFLRRYGLFPPAGQEQAQSTTPPASNGDLVTIPVISMEQADNAPIDAFRTFIYPNFSGNEIYVKKIDDTGKAEIKTYLPKGMELTKGYEDMSRRILDTLADIDKRLKGIERKDKKGELGDVSESAN